MPRLISEITEIVTGVGMLGHASLDDAMAARPTELVDVDEPTWAGLAAAWQEGHHRQSFHAAFINGAAFLRADDALRGRRPRLIEWRGRSRSVGDEAVPADLRIDHVYLVSCKYLSRILVNSSPANLFERSLASTGPRIDADWFSTVAAPVHQELYQQVVRDHGDGLSLPLRVGLLSVDQRAELRAVVPRTWSPACGALYSELCREVSARSAERWQAQLGTATSRRAALWRLLRIGSAPYFVLGSGAGSSLRLRVLTPWDWHRAFELRSFEVEGDGIGQPRVSWRADVRERDTGLERPISGHVEIRWSHGRFGGLPEAKVYLDTPHQRVPGYEPLLLVGGDGRNPR